MGSLEKNIFLLEYRFDHELLLNPIIEEMGKHGNYNLLKINLMPLYSFLDMTNTIIKSIIRNNQEESFVSTSSSYKKNVIGEKRAVLLGGFCAAVFRFLCIIPGIRARKPDIMVVVNDLTLFGKAAVTAGQKLGIPSLRISASVVAPNQLMPPVSADFLAVSGEAIKEVYVQSGVQEDKIIITGNPRFDKLYQRNEQNDRNAIFTKFNLDRKKKLIVLTTENASVDETDELLRAAFSTVNEIKDIQLIVKPHPAETSELHKLLLYEMNINNAIIVEDIDIYELLNAADCVLTSFSATGLEAMMLGKPVISINLTGEPDRMPYAESGAAFGVYHEDELAPAIMNALTDNDVRDKLKVGRESFVERYNYRMDGRAAERVVELLQTIELNQI